MINPIDAYFQAEKSESLLFLAMGIAAVTAGVVFLARGSAFLKGMAYPLIAIALIQVVVGGAVYFRTDRQVAGLKALYHSNSAEYRAQELQRMERVNGNFDLYKLIEIALLLAGFGLFLRFRHHNPAWAGVGLGLLVQAGIMLTLDFFAEHRADIYTGFILNL